MADNRRVKYTKMILRESLIRFLQEKPISRITVKEICEFADVNRATYYAHYADPYDQMLRLKEEFIGGINAYLDDYIAQVGKGDAPRIFTRIFEYIAENRQLCTAFLGRNSGMDFQEDFIQLIRTRVLELWQRDPSLAPEDVDYVFTFVALGCIGVVKSWLPDESGRKSPEDMADLVLRLANSGIAAGSRTAGRTEETGRKWTN